MLERPMEFRVYYEDTDAGGVVYHGRYVGFLERGRTEFFRDRGLSVQQLHDEGMLFPVVRLEIDFRFPARLDDLVRVETELAEAGKTSFTMLQRLYRACDERLLAEGRVTLVCVDKDMKPKRLPAQLREIASGE
jgi:acyl-CoA thioester hydrolase